MQRAESRPRVTDTSESADAPLIAHVIYRFDVGGMENGIVNLLNRIPVARYRHAIVCLTEYTDFRTRVLRPDVTYYALHKRPGKDPASYWRLWRLLRSLRPDIVHTRNLPALDALPVAALAGVPARVHGEHGREIFDIDGTRLKYKLLRQALRPLAHRYIALSRDLEAWLRETIGIASPRLVQIYNGVDIEHFGASADTFSPVRRADFARDGDIVIGTVGRMQAVKDQITLAKAFVRLLELVPQKRAQLRLVMVGDGPLRETCRALLAEGNAESLCWFAGTRTDVSDILGGLDVFVLPSLAEGISNTILEAMASRLPVVATRVGGNAELVIDGVTGSLVPPADLEAMARALAGYVRDPELARQQGRAGRERVERQFSLRAMVDGYLAVYDQVLRERVPARR